MLDDGSDRSSFVCLRRFFFLSLLYLIDLLELVSFDEVYLFNESDNDGSGSGSPSTSIGSAGESVGRVSGAGYGIFFPTGIESLSDVVTLVKFVPRGVDSKGVRLIGSLWRQNIDLPLCLS